jgi:hypothetical protein
MGINRVSFSWFASAGIAFWFLLGFPFGNHNESYYWIARFQQEHAWDIVFTTSLASTFRPLGQGLAYLGWELSGGSSWAVQIFNFALAAFSVRTIALTTAGTRTFALAMAIAGASFFAGYVYFFHLHGIFYSPVLAVIAVLLYFKEAPSLPRSTSDWASFCCAAAVGVLFHPYALIIFLAYLAGLALERRRQASLADCLRWAVLSTLALLILTMIRRDYQVLSMDNIRALMSSYALTELSPVLSIVSAAFAGATLFSIGPMERGIRFGLLTVVCLCSIVFFVIGWPVILLWILTAVCKAAYVRQWALAGMTAGTALLPVIAPSGSPTYAIFAIIMSTIVLAWGWDDMERMMERIAPASAIVLLVVAALLVGSLRMGLHVPIVSRFAQPLLAEREKTKQLESVIDWMLKSEYRNWHLTLEHSENPVDAGRYVIERRYRPPTYQGYLDQYLDAQRNTKNSKNLIVTFGTHERRDMQLIKIFAGQFAGSAMVFE